MPPPIYTINNPSAEQVTSLYLYGTPTPPSDKQRLENLESPIIQVDVNEYMDKGPGRFASPADIELVNKFMYGFANVYNTEVIPPGRYTKSEILKMKDFQNFEGNITKVMQTVHDDGKDNFLERAYIWNTTAFMVDKRAIFVIEHNGNRYIENFALVPYVSPGKQENFDFLGGDIASDIVNPHLKSLIDPQNIGKPVYFAFNIEERHTVTYDINMHDRYLAQKTNQDYQTNLLLLPSGLAQMNKYINNVMSNLDNQAKQQTSATEHADSLRKLADNANFVAHWEPIQKVTDTMTRGREMVHQMKEEDWLARQRDVQSVTDAMTKGRQMIADEQYKVWYTKQQKVQEVTDLLDAARNGTLGHRKQVHYETVRHVTHTKPRGLHEGSHGQGVVQLQKALNLLGANLHTDGHFGASTEKALKEFQKAHHLKVDGELDKQTIKVMVKAIKEQEAKLSHMVGQSSPTEVHG